MQQAGSTQEEEQEEDEEKEEQEEEELRMRVSLSWSRQLPPEEKLQPTLIQCYLPAN